MRYIVGFTSGHTSRKNAFFLFLSAAIVLVVLALTTAFTHPSASSRTISKSEYQDRVTASWLGQIIGNIYGLNYEFKFLEKPGPDKFPLGFGRTLQTVAQLDGAFSDDDTDIEYIDLLQMEKYGPEPSYRELTDAWKYHIRDRIWAANRVALTLMNHGFFPPATGDSTNNPRWFEIDPQLVNEIWAVTAPGMTDYAVAKSRWVARMTDDGFAVEPTMFYAAMYSEAFFSSDVNHLIDTGRDALPAESRFAGVIDEMRALHDRYPDDWQMARQKLAERYLVRQPYNRYGWEPIDAILNGGAGVLALLYGEGDIQRTLDLACAIGFDADNQAATLTGLLALSQGTKAIPHDLLFPIPGKPWTAPYNDRYINVTRFDMPDASISEMTRRIAAQGEAVILSHGGRIENIDGEERYVIRTDTHFSPPFELLPPQWIFTERGDPVDVNLYASGGGQSFEWTVDGVLPPGIRFRDGRFRGKPLEEGTFSPEVSITAGDKTERVTVHFSVRSPNLAASASGILHNRVSEELNRLRDGKKKEPAFYSATLPYAYPQWYGYEWNEPKHISRLGLYVGFPREEWGWLKDPHVEYRQEDGRWAHVDSLTINPPFPSGDSKYLQPGMVDYDFQFLPVWTTAIRIAGMAGGHPVDFPPEYGSAVAELTVHEF